MIWTIKIVNAKGETENVFLVKHAKDREEAIKKLDYGFLRYGDNLIVEELKFNEDDIAEVL